MFADLFVFRGDRHIVAASVLVHAATCGLFNTPAGVLRLLEKLHPLSHRSDAVLFLACSILRRSQLGASDAIGIFQEAWRRGIYHLSLVALELLRWRRSSVTDVEAADIRLILEGCHSKNLMLSTGIVDAMLACDMVESPVSVEAAAEEFAAVLRMPDSADAYASAYCLISNCFEDIFDGAYWEALQELSHDEEIFMLTRAALGADTSSFNIEWILRRLVKFADARSLPAFVRWATMDPADSLFPQGSTIAFFMSVAACATVKHPLRMFPARSKNHEAWQALAEIVYAMNGGTTTTTLSGARTDVKLDLCTSFPAEFRQLLEQVVRNGLAVTSIHRWGGARITQEAGGFVLGRLARLGNDTTVDVLRPVVTDAQWGIEAVEAIRAIQTR